MSNTAQPLIVKLSVPRKEALNESFVRDFGTVVTSLLGYTWQDAPPGMGAKVAGPAVGPDILQRAKNRIAENEEEAPEEPRAKIVGTPTQIAAFGRVLGSEKKYMEAFLEHGLDDPQSMQLRADLNEAIADFESETGIIWPLR